MKYRLAGLCIVLTAALSGCQDEPLTQQLPVDMSNPAAKFCVDQGGQYLVEQQPQGKSSLCVLDNGSKIDAWEFFRKYQ